jgi:hypothetical protein
MRRLFFSMGEHQLTETHLAVWRFVEAVHEGNLKEIVNHPIYTSHVDFSFHYVPALALHQVQNMSRDGLKFIENTLDNFVDEGLLKLNPRAIGVTETGEKLWWDGQQNHPHPEFTKLWVPSLLPQSSDVINDWPDRDEPFSPFSQVYDAAESQSEAELVMTQIEGMVVDRERFDDIMQPVKRGDISLREAVAQALTQ